MDFTFVNKLHLGSSLHSPSVESLQNTRPSQIHWSLEQYIDHALLLSGSSYNVGFAKEERNNPPVSDKPESAHVMPAKPESDNVMPATPESAHVVPATPKSTGPVHVMATLTEPHRKMAATPESRL